MKKYAINEIFYSLQGEGLRGGAPSLFLRFCGCNLQCTMERIAFNCDTEFTSALDMTSQQILERRQQIAPRCKWIVCTGDEPLLQLDAELTRTLKQHDYRLAVETNGTVQPARDAFSRPRLDYLLPEGTRRGHSGYSVRRTRVRSRVRARNYRPQGQRTPEQADLTCPQPQLSDSFPPVVHRPT